MPDSTEPDNAERASSVVHAPTRAPSALPELLAGVTIVLSLLAIGDLLPALLGLTGVLATQTFVILVPTIIYGFATETDLAGALALRKPHVRDVLGALVMAIGMCPLSTALVLWQQRVTPISTTELQAFQQLETQVGATPGLAVLALIVAPAVAEEMLFRGLLLTRLRRRIRGVPASIVCGVLFGLFHRSVHRLLAQSLLGVLAAVSVVRSGSIWPSVALHGTYNFIVLVFGAALLETEAGGLLTATGLAFVALGQGLVQRRGSLHNA